MQKISGGWLNNTNVSYTLHYSEYILVCHEHPDKKRNTDTRQIVQQILQKF